MSSSVAVANRTQKTGTGNVTCNTCIILSLSVLLALGLVFWYTMVHARIVFLQDPFLDKSNIPYYALMSDHDAARAQLWSFDGILYLTDFLLVLLTFATPGYFLGAICCHVRTIWPLTLLYFLFGLWWLFKAVYLTFYWTNSTWLWSNFACDRYPFCRNRDISMDPSNADTTFIIEVISCYVIGIGGLLLGCLIGSLWSGVRERQLYAYLQTDAPCEKCGTKPRSLLDGNGKPRSTKENASDDDSISSEFTVDDNANTTVVNRNTQTTATKRMKTAPLTITVPTMNSRKQMDFEIPDLEF